MAPPEDILIGLTGSSVVQLTLHKDANLPVPERSQYEYMHCETWPEVRHLLPYPQLAEKTLPRFALMLFYKLGKTYELVPDKPKWRWTHLESADLPDMSHPERVVLKVLEYNNKIIGVVNDDKSYIYAMTFDMTKATWSAPKRLDKRYLVKFFFKWKYRPRQALIFTDRLRDPPVSFDLDKIEIDANGGKTNIKLDSGSNKPVVLMKEHELTKPFRRQGLLALVVMEEKIYFLDWKSPLKGFHLLTQDKIVGKRCNSL